MWYQKDNLLFSFLARIDSEPGAKRLRGSEVVLVASATRVDQPSSTQLAKVKSSDHQLDCTRDR